MEARVSGVSINVVREADDYYRSRSPEDKVLLIGWMRRAEKGKDFADEMYSAFALKTQMLLHYKLIDTLSVENPDEYYASVDPDIKVVMLKMMKHLFDNEHKSEELRAARELRELHKTQAERNLLPRVPREGDQSTAAAPDGSTHDK